MLAEPLGLYDKAVGAYWLRFAKFHRKTTNVHAFIGPSPRQHYWVRFAK
jgi:hypothetical protein